ncbi:MAG TPA: carboxymuconolactone decarboxylase family protein [Longimicrobiales bacterium]|nr:carboxymuconolactone decarboxylase family protein [Longimicrobiales bacterium]
MTGSGLAPETRVLVRISAALAAAGAAADGSELEAALEAALRTADPEAVEEVILQSYLFLGYPAALNAFGLWRRVSGRRPAAATEEAPPAWADRGREVCRAVYGGQYDGLRANVRALHPDMERWMVVEGYGKVLGRPGLDLPTRELCVVALLAVARAPVQLYSHLRGALNVGVTPDALGEALAVAAAVSDPAATRTARTTWERVRRRREGPADGGAGV